MSPDVNPKLNPLIHPTAVIDPSAELAADVQIGAYAQVGQQSRLARGCVLAPHAIVGDYTELGPDCRIAAYAVVGSPSQDLKHQDGCRSWLKLGSRNRVREFATVNRATAEDAITQLGDDNLLMAYAHVAHDCQIGNRVVLANGATLGGHVTLQDDVIIGAMSGIHQFVQIGRLTMVGAMSRVCNDVPPYMLVNGSPPRIYGLNQVGLRRADFNPELRAVLKTAFQMLYRRQASFEEALEALHSLPQLPEVQALIQFCQASQRGLVGFRESLF